MKSFCQPNLQLHTHRQRIQATPTLRSALPSSLPAPGPAIALAGAASAILGLSWADARRKSSKPFIQLPASPTAAAYHEEVLSRCPSLHEVYKCVPGLTNGHVETIFAAKLRRAPGVEYARECLIQPDQGCVAIDWDHEGENLPEDAPIVILMPGLTGGSGDSYVLHAVSRAREQGMRAVVCNGRGTGRQRDVTVTKATCQTMQHNSPTVLRLPHLSTAHSPVTTPQYYSASFTGDVRAVINHIHRLFPHATLTACGWSLGANILIKYLAEEGKATPLAAAVSMCNPFDLTLSSANFGVGFNKIYDWNLASTLRSIMSQHTPLWRRVKGKFKPDVALSARTIKEFDDAITIHSFGWESTDEYYARSSSAKAVPQVAIPLLCLQAMDDPIAPSAAIPYLALRDNPYCVLATTPCGGHLGWVSGKEGPLGAPWSNEVMLQWIVSVLKSVREGQGVNGGVERGGEGVQGVRMEQAGAK